MNNNPRVLNPFNFVVSFSPLIFSFFNLRQKITYTNYIKMIKSGHSSYAVFLTNSVFQKFHCFFRGGKRENCSKWVDYNNLGEILKRITFASLTPPQGLNILPNNGLSEVTGIVVDTMFRNTVKLRRIVTPAKWWLQKVRLRWPNMRK